MLLNAEELHFIKETSIRNKGELEDYLSTLIDIDSDFLMNLMEKLETMDQKEFIRELSSKDMLEGI